MSDSELSMDKLTRIYIKMRDKREARRKEMEAELAELDEAMASVKGQMLEFLDDANVESVRTASGLVYRTVKTRYWTNDWNAMHKFIVSHNLPEFLEKRLNQGVVKQYLDENPEAALPGLNANTEYVITVKRPT